MSAPAASRRNTGEDHSKPPPTEDEDFDCPICYNTMKEVFVTKCGHSYCYTCITSHLGRTRRCPICQQILRIEEISPNFTLNKLIEKAAQAEKRKIPAKPPKPHDIPEELSMEDINNMLAKLQNRKAQMQAMEREGGLFLLKDFLLRTREEKQKVADELNRQLYYVAHDIERVEAEISTLQGNLEGTSGVVAQVPSPADVAGQITKAKSTGRGKKRTASEMESPARVKPEEVSDASVQPMKLLSSSKLVHKQCERIQNHLSDLQERYFESRLGDATAESLDSFSSTLSRVSRCSRLRHVATLHYADSLFNSGSSIVSSIDFDKDDEFFATAGVMKKIKIFDYGNVISDYRQGGNGNGRLGSTPNVDDLSGNVTHIGGNKRRKGSTKSSAQPYQMDSADDTDDDPVSLADNVLRYPILEIPCTSKISCLSWNPYIKTHLASSDYEGIVHLWDSATGAPVRMYDEHEKRAWSVDWSRINPQLLASGGDDTKVKIWSSNQRNSVATIISTANVCSVNFNPEIQHQIAFGSADHHIHYYDMRNLSGPLHVFKGHRKAVSYVKFKDRNTLISASTDCTLRMWSVAESIQSGASVCTRTFSGHANEKNFVGMSLDSNAEFIACGSETNDVYVYWWQLPKPIVVSSFGRRVDTISGQPGILDNTGQFVSAVCWQRTSPGTMVAANSQGKVTVMEMV